MLARAFPTSSKPRSSNLWSPPAKTGGSEFKYQAEEEGEGVQRSPRTLNVSENTGG